VNVREWRRITTGPPRSPELAVALARASAEGNRLERTAGRRLGDLQALLATVVALKQESPGLGYAAEPYDAHLDDYEPGETAAGLAPLLEELRISLVKILEAVGEQAAAPGEVVRRHFPVEAQERLPPGGPEYRL